MQRAWRSCTESCTCRGGPCRLSAAADSKRWPFRGLVFDTEPLDATAIARLQALGEGNAGSQQRAQPDAQEGNLGRFHYLVLPC